MPEALRKYAPPPAPAAPVRERPAPDALRELLPEVRPAEDNDNDVVVRPRVGERTTFEMPRAMWAGMVACYALFLVTLLAATGGGRAAFVIAVSAVYVAVFFGTAKIGLRQQPQQAPSPLVKAGGKLQTIYGPLGLKEVAVQMLVVPGAVVLFGLSILVIRLSVA